MFGGACLVYDRQAPSAHYGAVQTKSQSGNRIGRITEVVIRGRFSHHRGMEGAQPVRFFEKTVTPLIPSNPPSVVTSSASYARATARIIESAIAVLWARLKSAAVSASSSVRSITRVFFIMP